MREPERATVAAGSRAYLYCSTATIEHRALMLGVRSVSERDFIAAVSRPTWSPFLFPRRISRPPADLPIASFVLGFNVVEAIMVILEWLWMKFYCNFN